MRLSVACVAIFVMLFSVSFGVCETENTDVVAHSSTSVNVGEWLAAQMNTVDLYCFFAEAIILVVGWKKMLLSKKQKILIGVAVAAVFLGNKILYIYYSLSIVLQVILYGLSFGFIIVSAYLYNRILILEYRQFTTDKALKKVYKKNKNKKIVSIQVFDINRSEQDDSFRYEINYHSGKASNDTDINCILKMSLDIPKHYAERLDLVLMTYKSVVETGSEEKITALRDLISSTTEEIKVTLSAIEDVASITKEQCVLARLLVLFLSVEALITCEDRGYVGLYMGELGFSPQIEERLFSMTRTGLVGSILIGNNALYAFDYKKNGNKRGRKYCSFKIDSPNESMDHFNIGLVVIEGDNNAMIRNDIISAVRGLRDEINSCFNRSEEE